MKKQIKKIVNKHFDPTFDFLEAVADSNPKTGQVIYTGLVIAFPIWCMFSFWVHDD
jgi:hypothetical protein